MRYIRLIVLFSFFSMNAFAQTPPDATGAVPAEVVQAVPEAAEASYVEETISPTKPGHVTVNFKGADITAVLEYLSEVSGVDIVPSPDVRGPVTLKLTDKPWDVALELIVKNYGYAYERDRDIIRVVTVSSLKMEELNTEVIPLNYATAEQIRESVTDILTDRGKLTFDTRTNSIIVTDLPTNIYKMKQIVAKIDKRTPQIMIEAKIIETVLDNDERLGIDWNLVIAAHGAKRPTTLPFEQWGGINALGQDFNMAYLPQAQVAVGAVTGIANVGTGQAATADFPSDTDTGTHMFPYVDVDQFAYGTLDFSQFSAVMQFVKGRSDTDIISSPRITTLNNKSAKMFVGKVFNYISEIEEKEDTGGSERWVYTIEKEEIGIRLLVTPHINSNGDIEIELKPEIRDVIGFQQVTEYFELPVFSTREAETQVMVRDAETIFIGGLIREKTIDADTRIPYIGDLLANVPFLSDVTSHRTQKKEKTELIIFLTVHIVKSPRMINRIATEGIRELKIPLDLEDGESQDFEKVGKKEYLEVRDPADVEKISTKKKRAWLDFRKDANKPKL
ncbi:MAG: hypothetical protein ISS91_04860 [Candidatus Omnitrophica bacterium]|nr:hypothetical protein [Candidatus Omnitrophota bacterium]